MRIVCPIAVDFQRQLDLIWMPTFNTEFEKYFHHNNTSRTVPMAILDLTLPLYISLYSVIIGTSKPHHQIDSDNEENQLLEI